MRLIVKDLLHITPPILAEKEASGGVFVQTLSATKTEAQLWAQVHVQNDSADSQSYKVRFTLRDAQGETVTEHTSEPTQLSAGAEAETVANLDVVDPALWSPRSPELYWLVTEVVRDAQTVDSETTRVGIRHVEISDHGFTINDEPMYLRGTNRHQEYPYVGNALSAAAQYRDAKKIKDAGFDYVRLSHYPEHPAFYDACDELGILVMDAIPGWQYFGSDPAFAEGQYENTRRLVRRDRNHPSVVLWEVSLNKTSMPGEFITKTNAIAHAEYPGDQMFTSGWKAGYDVFLEARQHGGCTKVTNTPCIVSEYGDWEYYAQNAGLDQENWANLAPDDANSRQLRWHGEAALLQQATNFEEAHNDNQATIAVGDGLWVMFDYNRGYAPEIESSGCMDILRLPKFSYYFFQSQRDASESQPTYESGPMVFIANYWTASSDLDVRVFSNADEVALYLNGDLIDRRSPDVDDLSSNLAHPPFTFSMPSFEAGTLEAIAFSDGKEVARHSVTTPGEIARLELGLDLSGRPFAAQGKDTVFVHARLLDENGTLVPDAWENVSFGVTGAATLIGDNPFSSDAGIASNLLQSEITSPQAAVYALSVVEVEGSWVVLGASAEADAEPAPFELHVSTDGTPATASSPLYDVPLSARTVHATLTVDGQVVATASSDQSKFRIQGSIAP